MLEIITETFAKYPFLRSVQGSLAVVLTILIATIFAKVSTRSIYGDRSLTLSEITSLEIEIAALTPLARND